MIKLEKNKLEEIIDDLECPEDFKCYKSNFNELCEIEDVGLDSFVLCLDKKSKGCIFSITFADSNYCKCPLRVYIAKELKK